MSRLKKLLLWSIVLLISFSVLYFGTPKKIMMYYGGSEVEEMFDASQWFASGMYKTRNIEADGSASYVTMLRNQLKPFTTEQLAQLPLIGSSELRYQYPELDRSILINTTPDFSYRIRYAYSAFAKPNQPEDYYWLYVELNGRRFVITFSRDAQTGSNLTGRYAKEVFVDSVSQTEHRKVFAEIAEYERNNRNQ